MNVLLSGNVPTVTCTKDEISWYLVFANARTLEFSTRFKQRSDHCDPARVNLPEDHVGFCFQRRPLVRFLIGH